MIKLIANELPNTKQTCILPGLDKMARLTYDDVYSIRYFDMVVPVKHMNSLTSDKNKT